MCGSTNRGWYLLLAIVSYIFSNNGRVLGVILFDIICCYLLLFVVICLIVIDILLNSLVSYYHRYYNGMVLFIFRALLFV